MAAASKIVEETGGDIKEVLPFAVNRKTVNEIISSREIFFERLRALFEAIIEYRASNSEGRYQAVILKARVYIDTHYRDSELSLNAVASHVGISPNHLSTVFAQETGENFIDYLTRLRIEKAKKLLTETAMKSADIAYETGFSDPHYFSTIFKKHCGASPREFRAGGRSPEQDAPEDD